MYQDQFYTSQEQQSIFMEIIYKIQIMLHLVHQINQHSQIIQHIFQHLFQIKLLVNKLIPLSEIVQVYQQNHL